MTLSSFLLPHFRRPRHAALCAFIFLLAAEALAADEKNTELLCIRNRPLVPVALNKVEPYYMLLDLSIPQTVIAREVADYLGLDTTSGASTNTRKVLLDSFRCGERPAVASECVVMDLAPLCGLLGATVAGIVNPRVFGPEIDLDLGRGAFRIRKADAAVLKDDHDPRIVKITRVDDRISVPVLLEGTTVRSAVLDTTFGGTIAIPESLLAELGIVLGNIPKLAVRSAPGEVDDSVGRVQIRLKSVRVGTAEIRHPLCAIEPGQHPIRIGAGFLRHVHATIHFDQGWLRLEPHSPSPPSDGPIIGCGLGLASFHNGLWTLWIALNSPADRAGIPPGSTLISVNGKDMEGASHAEAFASLPSEEGKEAEIVISHGKEVQTVTLKAETLL